jgi:hypothetical protein
LTRVKFRADSQHNTLDCAKEFRRSIEMKTSRAAAKPRQQSRIGSDKSRAPVKRKVPGPKRCPEPVKPSSPHPPGAEDPMVPQPEDEPNRKLQR